MPPSRLGLRSGEIAGLQLEHLDWRAGEFIVCGKGSREERLPLPADVGEAIVAWLPRRPSGLPEPVRVHAREAPHTADDRHGWRLRARLGITSIYLQGIDPEEIITAVRTRRAPMMSAGAGSLLWRSARPVTPSGSRPAYVVSRASKPGVAWLRSSACWPPSSSSLTAFGTGFSA
jgi:integrase